MSLEARPYLREIQFNRDDIKSFDAYPFCIPAVKELYSLEFHLGGYGGKSLHQQSHDESFMATLLHKLRGNGLYIMDEPEAALSPSRQMATVSAIHQLVEENSQFIIATHSPILLAYPRPKIDQFMESGIVEVAYEDTEHYTVTIDFLNRHEQMMKILRAPLIIACGLCVT